MCDSFHCESYSMAPLKSATNGVLCTIEITPKEQCVTADQFILFTNEGIRHVLTHCMAKGENLEVFTTPAVTWHKIKVKGKERFKYAVVASLHYKDVDDGNRNLNRQSNYEQFIEQYDFTNISHPATANVIERFMKQNKDVAINALLYIPPKEDEHASVVPIYRPPHSKIINRKM